MVQSGEYLINISGITDVIDPRKIVPKIANKAGDYLKYCHLLI